MENQLLVLRFGFGEDDKSALIREVLEESGLRVSPDSIRPFGQVQEKRLSIHENMTGIRSTAEQEAGQFTESKKRHGMQQV